MVKPLHKRPPPTSSSDAAGVVEGQEVMEAKRTTTRKKSKKGVSIQVKLLDDSVTTFRVQYTALGKWLLEQVCALLHLVEVDYFGLEYYDPGGTRYWLEAEKAVCRQLSFDLDNPILYFSVKFYAPDPSVLEDELTRYLFVLQIKKDLSEGSLHVNEEVAALLGSYIVQSELGDYDVNEFPDQSYVGQLFLVPHQDAQFEWKVMDHHRRHHGLSPSESDVQLLVTAVQADFYGIKLTPVKDEDGLSLNIAVNHSGIIVYQNRTRVNDYPWTRIRKICFKRKKFFLKLHDDPETGPTGHDIIVEFSFESRNEAKNFWKKSIEQHTFFMCQEVTANPPSSKTKIVSKGSSFRYSGRTQAQLREYVKRNISRRQPFDRTASTRASMSSLRSHPGLSLPVSTPNLANIGRGRGGGVARSVSAQGYHHLQKGHHHPQLDSQDAASCAPFSERCVDDFISVNGVTDQMRSLSKSVMTAPSVHTIDTTDGNGGHVDHNDLNIPNDRRARPRPQDLLKETLMMVRTFSKELDLICAWVTAFQESDLSPSSSVALNWYFSFLQPLTEIHSSYLRQLEESVSGWCQDMDADDPLLPFAHFKTLTDPILTCLNLYESLMESLPNVYSNLTFVIRSKADFEKSFRDFESMNGCYLPFTSILVKPLFHCRALFPLYTRLADFVSISDDQQEEDLCHLDERIDVMDNFLHNTCEGQSHLLNHVYMIELQRDVIGMSTIYHPERVFLRQGVMLKLSKKGYQQRMFFLFNDLLVYCSRSPSTSLHFKIHGSIQLENAFIELTPPKATGRYPFTIYAGDRALMVATTSDTDRQTWIRDINVAASMTSIPSSEDTSSFTDDVIQATFGDNNNATSPVDDKNGVGDDDPSSKGQSSSDHKLSFRTNTMSHVCWHRSTSIGRDEYEVALTTCLSGFLLRKFKSSSGWQKLWVVFSGFCLFFYKTFDEDVPLASLPLLGYSLSLPTMSDDINKDHVFKLSFKTHVYYFRTDNDYDFVRWTDAIRTVSTN